MVQDNPYDAYANYDGKDDVRFYTKTGLFGAWKARASQYLNEKDPWKTFNSVDENKFHWTWQHVWDDPVGTFIGRKVLNDEEVEEKLRWKDHEEVANFIKKESDYIRIMPNAGPERGGSQITDAEKLEKKVVQARIYNNFMEPMEVEGEKHYERRTIFEMNWIYHLLSFGHYKYDPYETKSVGPGRTAYPGGDMIKEKPVSGPNIRGRYARDLRGDKDVLYEFTNTNDFSHLGSDLGSNGFANAEGILEISNKFLYKETLD